MGARPGESPVTNVISLGESAQGTGQIAREASQVSLGTNADVVTLRPRGMATAREDFVVGEHMDLLEEIAAAQEGISAEGLARIAQADPRIRRHLAQLTVQGSPDSPSRAA